MIKNIIFDIGNVLLNFNPKNYLKHINVEDDTIDLFTKLIWGSEDYQQVYDKGEINHEEMTRRIYQKNEQYGQELKRIFDNWDNSYVLTENQKSITYLKELKERGYKIYVLSNVSHYDLKFDKENFDFFNIIDGEIYSCNIGCLKPDIRIYMELLNKYNLKADECIFIDDGYQNVEGANSVGIYGIQFLNFDTTKEEIEKLLK